MGTLPKWFVVFGTVISLVQPVWMKGIQIENDQNNTLFNDFTNFQNFSNATVRAGCDCGWRNQPVMDIVGGEETGVNEYPYMAAMVRVSTLTIWCGATIISSKYLLTAGHCVYQQDISNYVALVGEHDITTGGDTPYSAIYYLNAYEISPGYNPTTYDNDIAIIRTATAITFSSFVAPVCLPFRYSESTFANQLGTILGWGQIFFTGPTSNVLLKANLNIISNYQCNSLQTEQITANEICTFTNGKDSCQSDSGGPLLWTNPSTNRLFLVGLISHGVGCAANSPGINSRVTSFLNWILSRTPDAVYCLL